MLKIYGLFIVKVKDVLVKMKREILPFSYLILYSKGWIRFPWLDYEKDYYKIIKTIFKMDGYWSLSDGELVSSILNAVDVLKEFYEKHNENFSCIFKSHYLLYKNIVEYKSIYDIKTFEEAVIKFCISEFSRLNINNFAVNFIDYKELKLHSVSWKFGMTYTSLQKRFNKSFKDLLILSSYKEKFYHKNLKDV